MPRPSINQILGIALMLNLALSGYLISRPDMRSVASSPTVEKVYTPSLDSSNLISSIAITQTPVAGEITPLTSSDINTLVAQMQDSQKLLQATTNQLDQKSQSLGLYPSGNAMKTPIPGEDIPELWTEIEQLNQVMQPLMVQLETATANRSSRSASELAALRTQVNTIHQRLAFLLARVEAAKSQTNFLNNSGTFPASANQPEQVTYEQLYQTMLEVQNQLNQMQSQVTYPRFHP
jgi:hypothetical protein